MSAHTLLWSSPSPLWGRFRGADPSKGAFTADDQARPAILRFANDEFMEQIIAMLADNPRQLGDLVAAPETWRLPGAEPPGLMAQVALPRMARALARRRLNESGIALLDPTTRERTVKENSVERTLPLKLYQPAHQRHYLVAANFVCGVPGFPDRELTGSDQVGFVIRRFLPVPTPTSGVLAEFAFIKDGASARWQQVAPLGPATDPQAHFESGEELLPLFPLNYTDDVGHPRRLLGGIIPVGRREQYMSSRKQTIAAGGGSGSSSSSASSTGGGATAISRRKEQFRFEVSEPWKALIESAHMAAARIEDSSFGDPLPPKTRRNSAIEANDQFQWQSWLLLLDFADFLKTHVPAVWAWVNDESSKEPLSSSAQPLYDWLSSSATDPGTTFPKTGGRSATLTLKAALKAVRESPSRERLESAVVQFSKETSSTPPDLWPTFEYLLVGVRKDGTNPFTPAGIHQSLGSATSLPAELALLDTLVQKVVNAIDTTKPSAPAPPIPFAAELAEALTVTAGDPGWFALRCVHSKPDCGPLHPAVLSVPSQRFQLAGFFDPDAPARPIRIALPLDTTPAGMRKFNKNTAFILSDVLCGQVQRAKKLGFIDLVLSVLPWPFHKDLDVGDMGPCTKTETFGMICSLSIPIITICALILLIIIVILLDLIFKWIPWFIICFPVPGLKAKK